MILPAVAGVFLFAGCTGKNNNQQSGWGEVKSNSSAVMSEERESEEAEEREVKTEYVDVSPEEAKKMIDEKPDLVVIDVSPKYAEGHLPGAINYYVGDGSLDRVLPDLDPQAEYLVYCHVDSASILGAQKLIDAGFQRVYRLAGNYQAWIDAGFSVEK